MSTCKYLNTSSPCPFGHDAVRGIEQGIDHQHLAAMTATYWQFTHFMQIATSVVDGANDSKYGNNIVPIHDSTA